MRLLRRRARRGAAPFRMSLASNIAVMLSVALGTAVGVGALLWWSLGRPAIQTPGPWTPAESFNFVKIVLAVVAGIGGVVALVVAYRRQRLGEAAEQREDARLYLESFARATEQVGSQSPAVRLAGMYALERLAQDDPDKRQTIVNVLCAYLRMPLAPSPGTGVPDADFDQQERQVRRTVQRILALHLQPGADPERPLGRFWPDIDLDLTGATLDDFQLDDCRLRTARFDGTRFIGRATFRRTRVDGNAWFREARFDGFTTFAAATFHRHASFLGARWDTPPRYDETRFLTPPTPTPTVRSRRCSAPRAPAPARPDGRARQRHHVVVGRADVLDVPPPDPRNEGTGQQLVLGQNPRS
jgi:hypothetical protein